MERKLGQICLQCHFSQPAREEDDDERLSNPWKGHKERVGASSVAGGLGKLSSDGGGFPLCSSSITFTLF